MKKRVTLSFESKVYDDFQDYCEKEGWIISRKLEICMEDFLKELKEKEKKK